MTMILDGKKLSEELLENIKKEVAALPTPPRLAIVMVGDNPSSELYINKKKDMGEHLGIDVRIYRFPATIGGKKLRAEVGAICKKPRIGGVIVQLPLPEGINARGVLNAVTPDKDVDVLSERASGALYTGRASVLPPTVAGIIRLLGKYDITVTGKTVAIVGFGRLVGKPAALELARQNATLLVLNEHTKDLGALTRQADIILSGVGKPGLISADMVKDDAVLIDAGDAPINGKTTGDIDPAAYEKASAYTPVPGGVGPMTVAMLFGNLVTLTKAKKKLSD